MDPCLLKDSNGQQLYLNVSPLMKTEILAKFQMICGNEKRI